MVAFIVGFDSMLLVCGFVFLMLQREARRVHIIGTLELPLPSEAGWKGEIVNNHETYTLGSVICTMAGTFPGGWVRVNDVPLCTFDGCEGFADRNERESRYVSAVKRAYKKRHLGSQLEQMAEGLRAEKLHRVSVALEKMSPNSTRSQ